MRDFALPGRSPVVASELAAATSHPLATSTAMTILRDGGNAVDAAIAACITQCVVEPHMTGIGGDCFAIVGMPDGSLHGLNGSGRSAAGAELDWYLENGFTEIPETSAHAITVPGSVKAWETLHQEFGSMDFARLFADGIWYAEHGFPVSHRVAKDWSEQVDKLASKDTSRKYLLTGGAAPTAGTRFQVANLSSTLRKIAVGGASAFYTGEIANDIASTIKELGGFLNEDDLVGVSADWVDLISADYNGHTLHEIPPNGQGLAALLIVKLMDLIGVSANGDPVQRAHLEIECGRIGYAARDAYISDPEYMKYKVEDLLSDAHVKALAKQFDPKRRNDDIALPDPKGSDTVYISVVDNNGMAVSFINSLFGGFGSGIVAPNTGVVLQNRACGFNLTQGHGNAIGPSKRPFHTIIPAMATRNGMISHCFGVMGGQYQAMGQAHVLSNMLDHGMNPQEALDDARIFWNDAGELECETGVSDEVMNGLIALGHTCKRGGVHGGGQIIQIDHQNGCIIAGSDPRKDGHASGF